MEIRDAREDDASAMASLASGEVDPHFLIRERTVRVAVRDVGDDQAGEEPGAIAGFLAFDTRQDAVSITRIGGSQEAVSALLDDVIEFAGGAELPVEAVVPSEGETAVALETRGFSVSGNGPRFDGQETKRFRLDPT